MAPLVLAGRLSRKRAKKPADRGGLVCGWRSVRAAVVLFAIRARRLIEGTGKDTGKGLLRIKAVFQADIINPLVGISQVAPPAAVYARECSARDFPLYCKNSRCRCHFEYPAWRAISSIRSGLMQIVINPFHDSVNHLSGYIHISSLLLNHSGG